MKRLGQKTILKRIIVGVATGIIMLTQMVGVIVASAESDADKADAWMRCKLNQNGTFGGFGCTGTSSMCLLQNCGLLDEKWQFGKVGDPVTLNSRTAKNAKGTVFSDVVKEISASTTADGGWVTTAPLADSDLQKMTGGKLKMVVCSDVKSGNGGAKSSTNNFCIVGLGNKDFRDMSKKELAKAFTTIWDAGYFAIVGVRNGNGSQSGTAGGYSGGHVSFFAGVVNDVTYISDVYDATTKDVVDGNGGICYAILYKADGTSPKEIGGGKVTVKSDTTENADGTVTVNGFWDESGFYQEVKLTDEPIVFPTFNELSNQDKQDVRAWKNDLKFRNNNDYFGIIRGIVAFLGIVLVVYSTFLYLAYQFDCINNIFEIQMLSILTLGRLRVSPDNKKSTFNSDKQESKSGEKIVVHKDMIIVCLIGISIGVLLLSGKIYALIAWAIKVVQGWLK